jgi:hypothetical protein
MALERNVAGTWPVKADEEVEQRRLAGSVWANKPYDFAGPD